jgi:PAS domain S-box-containing protein
MAPSVSPAIDFSELRWGTHLCHFYATPQDLLDTLTPFFKAGLEKHEYCLWVVSPSLTTDQATAALRSGIPDVDRHLSEGALEVIPSPEWYLTDGKFDTGRVIQSWQDKLEDALARGYAGMRINGNEDWLRDDLWRDFAAYERSLDEWIRGRPMIVICSYPLREGAIQILEVARAHQFALAKRQGHWEVLETPELRAAEEQARYRELFETSRDVIVLLDKGGRILDINRRGEELTGYSRVALLSMNLFEGLLVPEDAPVLTQMLADVDDRGAREYRIRWRTNRGEVLYMDGSAVARRSRTGEFVAAFCTLRDVTERIKSETAIRERVEAAREEERTRIARELHDELGSTLTRVRWDIEALEKEVTAGSPPTSPAIHDRFSDAARLVDSTIESVQRIAAELRPSILDDLGLVAALESQVQQFTRATGITCRLDVLLDVEGQEPTREQATALFRIAQEALTNVSRHARASLVNVILEERDGDLALEVRDNGVGIIPEAIAEPSALGILGMRERAALVEGHVDVSGRPGKGTVVTVRIPVRSSHGQYSDHR